MRVIDRPGYLGETRDAQYDQWDEKHGVGEWGLRWRWGNLWLDFKHACMVFEDAYHEDSITREDTWSDLFSQAIDIWDVEQRDTESGEDYMYQEALANHIQDIAIRRVGIRKGLRFTGNKLIRVRGNSEDELGREFSPYLVKFHKPEWIQKPQIKLERGVTKNSVESWWQNNKHLV